MSVVITCIGLGDMKAAIASGCDHTSHPVWQKLVNFPLTLKVRDAVNRTPIPALTSNKSRTFRLNEIVCCHANLRNRVAESGTGTTSYHASQAGQSTKSLALTR